MRQHRDIDVIRLPGLSGYADMLARQQERQQAVRAGDAPNTLYLLEHRPVVTLGRDAKEEHILLPRPALAEHGIEVVEAGRGGDVTYHGPGQLVAYPILDLSQWRRSVGWYLRSLEGLLIDLLADYGLHGERLEGYTGVWVGDAKVAAIGIGLRNWVTLHGIALNVAPNMDHFGYIIPCGIADKPVTAMAELLATPPRMDEVTNRFEEHFQRRFLRPPLRGD